MDSSAFAEDPWLSPPFLPGNEADLGSKVKDTQPSLHPNSPQDQPPGQVIPVNPTAGDQPKLGTW